MPMKLPVIFSSTLGLSPPWEITAVSFADDENRLDLTLDFLGINLLPCPNCGSKCICEESKIEIWYHADFFRYETYLHANVPHIKCCGAIIPVERPWSRKGSKFALLS